MKPTTFLSVVALLGATIAYAAPTVGRAIEVTEQELDARNADVEGSNYDIEAEEPEIETRTPKNLPFLNATQSAHARVIMSMNRAQKMAGQGCWAAITIALTETNMHVRASKIYPASLRYPHDVTTATGGIGIYAMQEGQGSVGLLTVGSYMDVANSTKLLLAEMRKVKNWIDLPTAVLCQRVTKTPSHLSFQLRVPTAKKICTAGLE